MKRKTGSFRKLIAGIVGGVALILLSAWSASAAAPDQAGNEACLACHSNKSMATTSTKGERIALYVDAQALDKSVHGTQVSCQGCHSDIEGYPHPKQSIPDRRSYALDRYTLCKKCHSVVYQTALDSVHGQVLTNSNQNAPICTDCHGYHDVAKPDEPRTLVSQTCAACHTPIYNDYVGSVHGKALVEENNGDVPVCTDCHGIHNIKEASTASFRIESPEVCAGCHTNKELMGKYNISTDVYQTYRQEFHGMTAQFYKVNFPTIWCYKAVCTDCHGVHGIKKPSDPTSSVAKANLTTTCGKCHEGANETFTEAWTGHLPPTPERGLVIWAVQAAWAWVVIPMTIGGMVIHVGFDWFKARQRKRKENEHESN